MAKELVKIMLTEEELINILAKEYNLNDGTKLHTLHYKDNKLSIDYMEFELYGERDL